MPLNNPDIAIIGKDKYAANGGWPPGSITTTKAKTIKHTLDITKKINDDTSALFIFTPLTID